MPKAELSKEERRKKENSRSYEIGTQRARIIIGAKVPYAKLFRKTKVKTSNHDYPESQVFDSKGTKLWTTCDMPIEGLDISEWPRVLTTGDMTCEMYESEDGELVAIYDGMHTSMMLDSIHKTKGIAFPDNFSVKKAKQYLKARLEPNDLWDESKFGLWLVVGP